MVTMTDHYDEFRMRAREWLAANVTRRTRGAVPPEPAISDRVFRDIPAVKARIAAMTAAGFNGIAWPIEYGGAGLGARERAIFAQEAQGYELGIEMFTVANELVGPTLLHHGTEEQRREHLPRILSGNEVWCQLFSEPGAGSDLASVRTRATRVDGGWRIDGQKVWTSGAQHSDFGILVARTDFSAPKHRGLSYFIVDMTAPGVDVRPLRQMTGDAHFAEVFLDGVLLPDAALVDEVGNGWAVVRTTLSSERVALGADAGVSAEMLAGLAAEAEPGDCAGQGDARVRDLIAGFAVQERVLQALSDRALIAAAAGLPPGPEASIVKLQNAAFQAEGNDIAVSLLGSRGALGDDDAPHAGAWQLNLLMAPYLRIAGGTDEVQRNIIAERILGLPQEPDPSRSLPFSELSDRI
jgi:alkylation response protein AidB-like acyl-CoA dehydrogenase